MSTRLRLASFDTNPLPELHAEMYCLLRSLGYDYVEHRDEFYAAAFPPLFLTEYEDVGHWWTGIRVMINSRYQGQTVYSKDAVSTLVKLLDEKGFGASACLRINKLRLLLD